MKSLRNIEDPVKKRAKFMGLLTKKIVSSGKKAPIIVGGEALEIYTQGSYTTGDIDIKAPKKTLKKLDLKYLSKRAKKDKVEDLLKKLLSKSKVYE